ncbi:fatty acid amide hydrolase-like isoform X2 [Amaranthus tricolor]|uniref:fatty acid amide hydrolase-like isoform X2 n=1 Tax=Amaranthus tricolor TaxID=29722 RepID=UPI00258B0180|nr:fatty acid amide hydrolase-like isoform X2 [Amaranthus tricolor]
MIAERIISALEVFNKENPTTALLISFDAEDVRAQAAASTQRFEEGKPISILDGVFMTIKDYIDCYPYPSNGLVEELELRLEGQGPKVRTTSKNT